MRKPEEIKKGLGCAVTGACKGSDAYPYYNHEPGLCIGESRRDALAYIQQLEADNAQQARCIENLTDKLNATNDALPRWISVAERLPERETAVLCLFRHPDITTVCQNYHYDTGHWLSDGNLVTHWMPLPEAPKEG